jgi:hypothetical protein
VHGSNVKNLSVYTSLSQISKNVKSFLLCLIFSLQQNWRSGQNKFCLEMRGREYEAVEKGSGRRDGPNKIYTYE